MTFPARHISVTVARAANDVYAYASDPMNLPGWAAGLGGSIARVGGDWVAESPMGTITVTFAGPNDFGVLDHDVTLPSGEIVRNPMRVVPNGDGSEVTFTLFRRPGMSESDFEADAATVHDDLLRLKGLLEA
jgi:hypothetical protein